MDARLKANPDLQLLLQLEPAHKVFFRNLTDAFLGRSIPPIATSTKPAPFWNDVFVPSALPWSAFMESMLWHLAVVSVLWTVAQTWIKQEQIQQKRRDSYLTYNPPAKTFPALSGRGPRVRERAKTRREATKSPLQVARDRIASEMKPPDLKTAQSERPNVMGSRQSSAMPLFAPKLPEARLPQALASALAPPANVGQSTTRKPDLLQASAVAPAANVGLVSSRRPAMAPSAGVVAPIPDLRAGLNKSSGASIGNPQVVGPSPQLTVHDQSGIPQRISATLPRATVVVPIASANGAGIPGNRGLNPGVDSAVIPPTPLFQGAGKFSGGKLPAALSGSSVISPPPSLKGGANLAAIGRSGPLAGGGMQAVPPPSSIGSAAGVRAASSQLAGASTRVIPPPASLSGGSFATGGRGTALPGSDQSVVPPPPSSKGTGKSIGGGRGSSLPTGDQQALPPPASVEDARKLTANVPAAVDAKAVPPAPDIAQSHDPATIELPVRVIGLALSLPGSSYFANYEVFIAERRLKKGDPELIKLVYESLPYQPRLSEYGLDNSKVYKLRVTRDPTCDETLLQMTWPQTDESHSGSKYATGPPALAPNDRNNLLPCYRTTADDYRRAVTRNR